MLLIQLLDCRHDPSADDMQMLEYLHHYGICFVAVLTKADKLKKSQYEPTLERFRAICEPFGCREVVLTSSDSGLGMDRVKQLMEEHLVPLESE